MKSLAERLSLLSLLAFGAVALSTGGFGRLVAQTSECNTSGSGDRCGTITKCTSWRLSSGEISTTGAGLGASCETSVEIYLFKSVPCIYCHYPIGGGGGTGGTGTGSGGSGGSGGSTNPCGDPNLWSDDSDGCDRETQQAH